MRVIYTMENVLPRFKFSMIHHEIQLSFDQRYKCKLLYQKYEILPEKTVIEINVKGKSEDIADAMKESEFIFKRECKDLVVEMIEEDAV